MYPANVSMSANSGIDTLPPKESWSYDEFRRNYAQLADPQNKFRFYPHDENEPKDLEEIYDALHDCRTLKDFAAIIYSTEQGEGAEDLPLKYKNLTSDILYTLKNEKF